MAFEPSRELVLKKVRDCFPNAIADALAVLDTYGGKSWHRERNRVQLAILMLSGRNLDRLRQVAELASTDYRDILAGAEYPEEFPASRKTTPQEMAAIRRRDRDQYEAWLRSEGG